MNVLLVSSLLLVPVAVGCCSASEGSIPEVFNTAVTSTSATGPGLGERPTVRRLTNTPGDSVAGGGPAASDSARSERDGEPAPLARVLGATPPPAGSGGVAARVALAVFNDPAWFETVAPDLEPLFLTYLRSQQRGEVELRAVTPVLLITVEADLTDPNTMLVAFDEVNDLEAIRHVTAVEFDDITGPHPLVVDVVPVA
ncbi:MAG: hypothetical protein GY701_00635 [Sulfitobacter sp.]|nr:hypothetical protein [Sulfitobacter sp.]